LEQEIVRQAKRNPKEFYWYVNHRLKTRPTIADLLQEDGQEVSDSDEKADMFSRFFSSLFTTTDQYNFPVIDDRKFKDAMTKITTDKAVVKELLQNLLPHKSSGSDNTRPEILTECANELSFPLYFLF
jgi:hypothetical protein